MNLSKQIKLTRVMNAQAVGVTTINSSIVDMASGEGVMFVLQSGAITDGTVVLKAQQGNLADGSDLTDLAGTATALQATDDNKCAVLDIYRPTKRYVRAVVSRTGATGAVIDSVVAIQYSPRRKSTIQDANTVGNVETWISPTEGVA